MKIQRFEHDKFLQRLNASNGKQAENIEWPQSYGVAHFTALHRTEYKTRR